MVLCLLPQVLERWNLLKARLIENRSKLGEAQNLQQFSRDCDGLEAWIAEKMQVCITSQYPNKTRKLKQRTKIHLSVYS